MFIVLKGAGEFTSYNRHPYWFPTQLSATGIKMTWQLAQNVSRPRAKLVIDPQGLDAAGQPIGGTEVTDWTDPTDAAEVTWNFVFNAPTGHHIACVRTEYHIGSVNCPMPFLVNDTGKRLPDEMQKPWLSIRRLDPTFMDGAKMTIAQVQWRPNMKDPYHPPLLPRDIQPFSTYVDHRTTLHVRRLSTHMKVSFVRGFVVVPPYWDIAIENQQKYFYNDTTSQGGFAVGMVPPRLRLTDGAHGVATYGQVYECILRDKAAGGGIYTFDPSGRVAFQSDAGSRKVSTLYGWRMKPGVLPVHAYYKKSFDKFGTPEYDARHEFVGDTSQLPEGLKRPHEPWGAVVWLYDPALVTPENPLGLNLHNGHEMLWADTLNHQILFLDHWTAHDQAHFAPAKYPPVGYVQAPAPTGKTTAAVWGGHPDRIAQPSEFFNEPWSPTVRLNDGKVYWTNFAGNNICRANIDGSNKEKFLQSSINPTNAEIFVNARLGNLKAQPGVLRGWMVAATPTDLAEVPAGTLKFNGVDVPAVPAAASAAERTTALIAAINSTTATSRVKAFLYIDKTRYYVKRANFTDRSFTVVSTNVASTGLGSRTAKSFLIDGPIGEATCIRPQAIKTYANGDLVWTERYTHALRWYCFRRQIVMTVCEFAQDVAEGDHLDGQICIDRTGSNGPKNDAWINCWKGQAHRIAQDGTRRQHRGGAGTYHQGRYDRVNKPGYAWANDVHEGREVRIGSAGGSQFAEYSKRLSTDIDLDAVTHQAALDAIYRSEFLLTHGAGAWEGSTIGCPTPEELVAWGETRAKAHLRNPNTALPHILTPMRGLTEPEVDAVWKWAQHNAQGYDLSTYSEEEEDPAVIAELQAQLAETRAQLADSQARVADLQAESAEKSDQITELNDMLASADQRFKDLAELANAGDAAIPGV